MPKSKSIGALWTPSAEREVKYVLSGVIDTGDGPVNIVIFKNTYKYKSESNQPDYRIYRKLAKKHEVPESPTSFGDERALEDDVPF